MAENKAGKRQNSAEARRDESTNAVPFIINDTAR